jgi:hypothetical protein
MLVGHALAKSMPVFVDLPNSSHPLNVRKCIALYDFDDMKNDETKNLYDAYRERYLFSVSRWLVVDYRCSLLI